MMRMRRVSGGGVRRVVVHGGEGVAVAPVVVRVREGHHVLLADGHESVGEEVRVWKQNRNAYDESPQIYCPTFSSPNFHSLSATAGGKQKDDFRRTECKCSLFLHRKIFKAFSFYSTLRMRGKAGEGISNNFLRFEFEFEWSVNEHACSLSLHLASIIIQTPKRQEERSLLNGNKFDPVFLVTEWTDNA